MEVRQCREGSSTQSQQVNRLWWKDLRASKKPRNHRDDCGASIYHQSGRLDSNQRPHSTSSTVGVSLNSQAELDGDKPDKAAPDRTLNLRHRFIGRGR